MSKVCEILADEQEKQKKDQKAQQPANDGGALVPIDDGDDGWGDAAAEASRALRLRKSFTGRGHRDWALGASRKNRLGRVREMTLRGGRRHFEIGVEILVVCIATGQTFLVLS
jgi:hypothetical protein